MKINKQNVILVKRKEKYKKKIEHWYQIEPVKIKQTGCYIGQTKRKISKRIEEHKRDIKLNKDSTALAQLNKKTEIKIDFENTKKLANYTNQSCALYREALEIKANRDAYNTRVHAQIDEK